MPDGSQTTTTAPTEENEADHLGHLIGNTGCQTIHHAACMLEYLTELRGEYRGDEPENEEHFYFGYWLIDTAIAGLIRHGLAQLKEESHG